MGSEFARLMEPVALKLLGEPQGRHHGGQEWRYGTRGSLSIRIDSGTFYDNEAGKGGGTLDLIQHRGGVDKAGALAWMRENKFIEDRPQQTIKPKIVSTYDYTDAGGVLLFQVCRFDPKDFRQRRPDGRGGWVWNMVGVRKAIYRLPNVLTAVKARRLIFIVEGEKAVEVLEAHGFTATCSPGGAGKWKPEYSPSLAGADVIVLPDCDDVGQRHAMQIERALRGVAWRVRIMGLPYLPDKGDVADYFAAGQTVADLAAYVEETTPRGWNDILHPDEDEQDSDDEGVETAQVEPDPVISARAAHHDIRAKLDKTNDGGVRATHANLALILKYDPMLRARAGEFATEGRL